MKRAVIKKAAIELGRKKHVARVIVQGGVRTSGARPGSTPRHIEVEEVMKVAISGWNVGFQKVKFAELLRRDFGYSLAGAKAATDSVSENRRVELPIEESQRTHLMPRFNEVGVRAVSED